ncbi:unnamed protein product, partial [Durusdinium trenchii]
MTSMERPETNAVVVDEPAAAGTALPAVGIDVVPTPKAAGPAGPPAGGEPNLRGGTVFGVLLQDRDLLTVPLDELMALSMASVEASDQLLSETPFEIAKAEAEKWHRSAGQALDAMHGVQSDLDKIQRIHAEEPTRNLAEIPLLPEGNGTNSGVTYQELQIRRQAYQLRQQHLRAGDVCGEVTNFMSQVAESDEHTKTKLAELTDKVVDLSNGLIGLASSVRHTQDEQLKTARQASKSLGDVSWQLSGVGKGVNTSVKESLLSIGKMISQLDSNVGKQCKAQDETNSLLKGLNTLMK